uniref:Gfo/Idh/MocA family oxidoreductase n=1 Tax=Roseihalotalea indica TaxID=2867963 RepID=A0AA49JBK1_9BACT|nr:Gfo/Idh/MocA family oxidoreductase [Tunicatimonas sp. TK19036]
MKQVIQNLNKGLLKVEEVPVPVCKSGGVLVRTIASAVSVGTEKMKLKNADMNYLQMAKAKPEQAKQVINTVTQLGPMATYRKVMNKLDSMTPLGYSMAGEVVEVGKNVSELKVGDIVACAGAGYANHAEVNYVPKNLCVKVPEGVDLREASFATIASIAMQGFRQTESQIGENVAVIGLGLLGQILVQLITANGCRAFGFDIDPRKCELAIEQGAFFATVADKEDFEEEIMAMTNGYGCDSVIITTATQSNSPIVTAGKIARDKAKVVDIGITKMDLPWDLYYHKEIDFRFSRSYGPGRYDPSYEEGGNDYPIGYVRWTEQRNMESILQLLRDRKIDFSKIITHEFSFENADTAYNDIKEGKEDYLGVVFTYNSEVDLSFKTISTGEQITTGVKEVALGAIGAGNYASTMLFPYLKHNPSVSLIGLATATGINAKDKAEKNGFQYATTDYQSLLGDSKVNTVLIATRHNQHAHMVVSALQAGKNVYVEKPLAISREELDAISEAYQNSGAQLMVGYNRRFAPSIKYTKAQMNAQIPYSIYYQVNAGFIPKEDWYQAPEQGGRIIGEVGHFVDTVQYLLSAKPVTVFASATQTADMPEQDNTFVTIKFDNGSTAVIAYLADGDKNYPKEQMTITGYRTNIDFSNFKEVKIYSNGKNKSKKYISLDKGQSGEMKAFVDGMRAGKAPVSFESLKLTTLVTLAAIESLQTGKVITIE